MEEKRLIDAEALIDRLDEIGGCGAEPESWSEGWDDAIDEAIRLVEKAPTIDPEGLRSAGQWEQGCVCSNCTPHWGPRNKRVAQYYRYCPFCGARMEE